MTDLTIEGLKKFIAEHGNESVVDFGGGKEDMRVRGLFKNYVSIDFETGYDLENLNIVEQFDIGICMDTLEHVKNPFKVAENIMKSLKVGAYLYVTVPFVWEKHDHPHDYFRFTDDGLKELFKEMECLSLVLGVEEEHIPFVSPRYRFTGVFKKIK